MTQFTTHIGRTARRLAIIAIPLLVAATGTAAAYGGGMMGGMGGMMGGGMGGGDVEEALDDVDLDDVDLDADELAESLEE